MSGLDAWYDTLFDNVGSFTNKAADTYLKIQQLRAQQAATRARNTLAQQRQAQMIQEQAAQAAQAPINYPQYAPTPDPLYNIPGNYSPYSQAPSPHVSIMDSLGMKPELLAGAAIIAIVLFKKMKK